MNSNRVITLVPISNEVVSFEDAFGEYSEARGRGKARRSKRKAKKTARKTSRRKAKTQKKARAINREDGKLYFKTIKFEFP